MGKFVLGIMTVVLFVGCGLPSQRVVSVPRILDISGSQVRFEINNTNGFVLYYRVYESYQIPERDLTESNFSREEDIFRSFNYVKSYISTATSNVRPRFIWQPTTGNTAPFTITLDTLDGDLQIADSSMQVIFSDRLIRNNLLSFTNFSRGDSDLPSGFSNITGILAWATMNMELDPQTMTLYNSAPVYLHQADITVG